MIYTNKHNYPDYVYKWLKSDDYDYKEGIISATTLMKPARAYVLARRNKDALKMDVSDCIALRYGTGLHLSFQQVNLGGIQEKRYYGDILVDGVKYTISGKPDIVIGGKVIDIKSTSVWSYIYGSKEDDYIKQLSIYRWLLSENAIYTKDNPCGEVCYLFTDWSKQKSKLEPDYPQSRLAVKPLNLMTPLETQKYIETRIRAFVKAEQELPDCTPDELWQSPDKWAVKKVGGKRAVKIFDNEPDAVEFCKEGYEIEYRAGKVKRCGYCVCSPFCKQYSTLCNLQLID